MKNKTGGIFTLAILVIVILIVGFVWFLKNMDVNTSVNIDLSRKASNATINETTLNDAAQSCVADGHRLEMHIIKDVGLRGICIDSEGNTCEEWAYYQGDCELEDS